MVNKFRNYKFLNISSKLIFTQSIVVKSIKELREWRCTFGVVSIIISGFVESPGICISKIEYCTKLCFVYLVYHIYFDTSDVQGLQIRVPDDQDKSVFTVVMMIFRKFWWSYTALRMVVEEPLMKHQFPPIHMSMWTNWRRTTFVKKYFWFIYNKDVGEIFYMP